jgi:glyoxylase-like metal-dependent hydrolase (beta-lactamase superfamily II)
MPHGSRRIGAVEAISLCDGVVTGGESDWSFPDATPEIWAETRERYPDVFDGDAWRLHVHATLLRVDDRVVLVDTGIGPETAPAFAWSETAGALDRELDAAGVSPGEIAVVVITHVHDDHVGWTVDPATARPRFENARYLIHRADLEMMRSAQDEENRAIYEATLEPLERLGAVDVSEEPVELFDGVLVKHAPGHTPGHQIVLMDSEGERAIVSADLVNNPVMLLQPGVNGETDADPELAWRTRRAYLESTSAEERLVIPTHFPEPFGWFTRDGDRYAWTPASV